MPEITLTQMCCRNSINISEIYNLRMHFPTSALLAHCFLSPHVTSVLNMFVFDSKAAFLHWFGVRFEQNLR